MITDLNNNGWIRDTKNGREKKREERRKLGRIVGTVLICKIKIGIHFGWR